jgi:benzodiazapine receptor
MNLKADETKQLVISLVICLSVGLLGSIFTSPAIPTWYAELNKPAFNPPNWLFGPVWTLLYILMAIAAWLLWQQRQTSAAKLALKLFALQLLLNLLWSFIFFGCHAPLYAYLEISLLWLAILFTIINAHRVSAAAAWLLIPYLFWVGFASVLNYAIWRLN